MSIQEDVAAILEIKDDIRSECSKLGDVTNVVLYDLEPAGIASVRFSTPQAAAACIRLMNGRHFDGRRVEAWIADGTERYKKTNERKIGNGEDEDAEEARRLDQFGAWLEEDGSGGAARPAAEQAGGEEW
jgi:HIV Tat-specific factor 1